MKSILEVIDLSKKFLELETLSVVQMPYRFYRDIATSSRGVYILEDDLQRCIYVGKGWIRRRQDTHWPKALGQVPNYQRDPEGWQHLRENNPRLDPREWTIYYVLVEQETAITALEGALIHLLQPLANDETFRDNK